jgi:hypothetical protein
MNRHSSRQLPPVGLRALGSGPSLTVGLMFVIAVLAPSQYAVPAPTLFLLITVVYAAALGGWRAGLASALVSLLYLAWLLTDSGRAAQYQPLDRTLLTVGGVAIPLGILAGWALHRTLQRERGHDWDEGAVRAHGAGVIEGREGEDRRFRMLVEQVRLRHLHGEPSGPPRDLERGGEAAPGIQRGRVPGAARCGPLHPRGSRAG